MACSEWKKIYYNLLFYIFKLNYRFEIKKVVGTLCFSNQISIF